MNIVLLNGNPIPENSGFEEYVTQLCEVLQAEQHVVTLLTLREMDIAYCVGCWSCWVKTPGQCVAADDSHEVCRACINADFVLFASPLIMGFPSAVLKKAQDKLIPLIHPYIEIVQGEFHHFARYDRYPKWGLLLEKGATTDEEDISIVTSIYQRDALNFKTTLCFTKFTTNSVEEVAHAIKSV